MPTRGAKGEVLEDNLDSPLVELDIIRKAGEKSSDDGSGRNEVVYSFNKEDKPEISAELFLYTLLDYREKRLQNSQKISFNQVVNGQGSPGQVFKIPESGVRERLELIASVTDDTVEFRESANSHYVFINQNQINAIDYINLIYKK